MNILQLQPPIPLETPRGHAFAHLVIDYCTDHILWVCFVDATGECCTFCNSEVRMQKNETMRPHVQGIGEFVEKKFGSDGPSSNPTTPGPTLKPASYPCPKCHATRDVVFYPQALLTLPLFCNACGIEFDNLSSLRGLGPQAILQSPPVSVGMVHTDCSTGNDAMPRAEWPTREDVKDSIRTIEAAQRVYQSPESIPEAVWRAWSPQAQAEHIAQLGRQP